MKHSNLQYWKHNSVEFLQLLQAEKEQLINGFTEGNYVGDDEAHCKAIGKIELIDDILTDTIFESILEERANG